MYMLCEDYTGCGIAPQCKSDNKKLRMSYQEYYIICEQKHKQTIQNRNITYSVNTEESTQPASRKAGAEKKRIKPSWSYIASQNNLEAYLLFLHRADNSWWMAQSRHIKETHNFPRWLRGMILIKPTTCHYHTALTNHMVDALHSLHLSLLLTVNDTQSLGRWRSAKLPAAQKIDAPFQQMQETATPCLRDGRVWMGSARSLHGVDVEATPTDLCKSSQ